MLAFFGTHLLKSQVRKRRCDPSNSSFPSFSASLASVTAANSAPSASQVVVLPGSSQPLFLTSELLEVFVPFVSVCLYFNWKLGVPCGQLGMMSSSLRSYLID